MHEGFRMNRLGLAIYEKFRLKHWMARCNLNIYGSSIGLQFPIQVCIDSLRLAYHVSLETGDVEFAFLSWAIASFYRMQTSRLSDVLLDVVAQSKQMALYGQDHLLGMMQPLTLTIQLLTGECKTLNESDFEKIPPLSKSIVIWIYQYRMMLSYLFGDYERAYIYSQKCLAPFLLESCFVPADTMFLLFFAGLSSVEHARKRKKKMSRSVSRCLKFIKRFSQQAPETVLSRQLLLEAEIASLRSDSTTAFTMYEGAIRNAKKAGYLMETALCNERAAKLAYSLGNLDMSRTFYKESLEYYQKWGATSKVAFLTNELRDKFGSLKDPKVLILEQFQLNLEST
jgi:hypothetical protein